jgi:predicted membrane channel-forming protein YqfA (hemolysin III family)
MKVLNLNILKSDTNEVALHRVGAVVTMAGLTYVFAKIAPHLAFTDWKDAVVFIAYPVGMALSYCIVSIADLVKVVEAWRGVGKEKDHVEEHHELDK